MNVVGHGMPCTCTTAVNSAKDCIFLPLPKVSAFKCFVTHTKHHRAVFYYLNFLNNVIIFYLHCKDNQRK